MSTTISLHPSVGLPLHILPEAQKDHKVRAAWLLPFKDFLHVSSSHCAQITKFQDGQFFVSNPHEVHRGKSCKRAFLITLKVIGWMTIILPIIAYIAAKIFDSLNPMINQENPIVKNRVAEITLWGAQKGELEESLQKSNEEIAKLTKDSIALAERLIASQAMAIDLHKEKARQKEEVLHIQQMAKENNQHYQRIIEESQSNTKQYKKVEEVLELHKQENQKVMKQLQSKKKNLKKLSMPVN